MGGNLESNQTIKAKGLFNENRDLRRTMEVIFYYREEMERETKLVIFENENR